MKNHNDQNIDKSSTLDDHKDLFSKMDVTFQDSKEDLWSIIKEKTIDTDPTIKNKQIFINWKVITSVAASLVFLIASFVSLYTQEISTLDEMQLSHQLPDGSKVRLNSSTSISYRPYMWFFYRTVNLKGEAFFEVQKGENFKVISSNGITEVLGTSFNINTRNKAYQVFCKTGKVRVSNASQEKQEILLPNDMITLKEGIFNKIHQPNENLMAWINSNLRFTSEPIEEVLKALNNQFGVTIELDIDSAENLYYSGQFDQDHDIKTILEMIGLSLNLDVISNGESKYLIQSKH